MLVMDEGEARNHGDVERYLASRLGDDFRVDSLYSGDFASFDTPLALGVERKEFSNLASSLLSGELDEQLAKLVETYDVPVLLVENLPPVDLENRVYYRPRKFIAYPWVVSTMVSWFARGVMPFFTANLTATCVTVLEMYDACGRKGHREMYAPRRLLPNLRQMPLASRVLVQFPGVGPKRATALSGYSLADLNDWTLEQWQEALGLVTGKKVYVAWHERG